MMRSEKAGRGVDGGIPLSNWKYIRSWFRASFLLLVTLAGAQNSQPAIAPASGKAMCSGLTPADFTKAGVAVSRLREAHLDDQNSAYCIYDGKAARIEFDIYDPAGDTPAEGQNAAKAAQAAIGGKFEPVQVAGADEATTNAASPKASEASIVVRKGTTVFNISIPQGGQARQQLVTLSEIVVSRLKP